MAVGYGILGCGMMGREHIRNISLMEGAEVAVLCDPDPAMLDRAGELAPAAKRVDTLEAFAAAEIDALVVASPNHLHAAQLEALKATGLPTLCEKPLYTDPGDGPGIAGLAGDWPAPFWVAMEYRYMPPVAAFLERVDGATGGIRMLSIREHRFPFLRKVGDWNRFNRFTGGTLVEKCCHHFDLMRHALRSEPTAVMASAGMDVNHLGESYGGEVPDILDNAFVIVDFASGARGLLDLCMFAEGSRYQEEISAVGADGKLECFVPGPTRFWNGDLGPPPVPRLVESPRFPAGQREMDIPVDPELLEAGDHNGATYYQHLKFLDAVRGVGRVEVTARDGAVAVACGLAAQKSAETGTGVRVDEFL